LENYILYGSGGHAKVVMECLSSENKVVEGFFDDASQSTHFQNLPNFGLYDNAKKPESFVLITIGNNRIRQLVSQKISHKFGASVFSHNIISPSVKISEGSMVLQGAVLNIGSVIGKHVIINTRAVVEHDCIIEDFVHLAPGSVVCGNCRIGEGTLIGANAVVAPNLTIGKWCQISAGSSVLEDIPDNSLVMGVPGKVIKTI